MKTERMFWYRKTNIIVWISWDTIIARGYLETVEYRVQQYESMLQRRPNIADTSDATVKSNCCKIACSFYMISFGL